MDDPKRAMFYEAQAMRDRELIRDVIAHVTEFYMLFGRFPTVADVLALLHPPS